MGKVLMKREVFPPHGYVELLQYTGEELDIVNAARVSFHNESEEMSEKDEGLLRYLLREQHGSPFEHGFLSLWRIRMPIFVMREWVRHRIGHSINEESGRYTELRPDFYIPDPLDVRTQKGKPGAYVFEPLEGQGVADYIRSVEDISRRSYKAYEDAISSGVAKELARIMLPLNLYTEIRWTANARSLMHFLSLRNSEYAQFEIRKYAQALEDIFSHYMPTVHKAFLDYERRKP
jgi:thymidylate synthase (FAD)